VNKDEYIKIISERCELVKLCDIYCNGPVFFRHTVVYFVSAVHWRIKSCVC